MYEECGTEATESGREILMGRVVDRLQEVRKNLEMVTYFQDIRQNLSVTDYGFPEVISNIQKARRIWDCLSRILVWESVDSWKLGRFYLIIAQAILLFGARPGW